MQYTPIGQCFLHLMTVHFPVILKIGPWLRLHRDNRIPHRTASYHTTSVSFLHPMSYSGHENTTPLRAIQSPSPQLITSLPAGNLKPWPFRANDAHPVFGFPHKNVFYVPLSQQLPLAIAGVILHQDGRIILPSIHHSFHFLSIQLSAVFFSNHTIRKKNIRSSVICRSELVRTPRVHI